MARLTEQSYMAFPFRMRAEGPATSDRARHVREQIEQVLFTAPGERVFRPEFGAGMRNLVFEPGSQALEELTRRRLIASLADALRGEVDPRTLAVEVRVEAEKLHVLISYRLATLGHAEQQRFVLGTGGATGG
jgi:phage baseplate assembly protein W